MPMARPKLKSHIAAVYRGRNTNCQMKCRTCQRRRTKDEGRRVETIHPDTGLPIIEKPFLPNDVRRVVVDLIPD